MRNLLRALIFLTLAGLVIIGGVRWHATSSNSSHSPAVTAVSLNVDLTGDWTTKPDARVKFVAEVQSSTILIHMISKGDTIAYYYGTFENPKTSNVIASTMINDGKMVWSTAATKQFIYQDESVIFDFEIAGVKSAIELVREK